MRGGNKIAQKVRNLNKYLKMFKSFCILLKTSSMNGRAERLRKKGKLEEAYQVACEGLTLLRKDFVDREFPPESTNISFLTMLVEQLSHDLKKPGACERDIKDTFRFLNDVSSSNNASVQRLRKDWLPYLEKRINDLKAHS